MARESYKIYHKNQKGLSDCYEKFHVTKLEKLKDGNIFRIIYSSEI